MFFLDEAVITARSGNGGSGCVSFRREKFIPRGGPDGGDGGNGGSVIVRSTRKLFTLEDYRSKRNLSARNGEPGKGKNKSGANGADCILKTPVGTLIEDYESGRILGDLVLDHQEIVLIPGGKGGRGNQHFATSTNRAPRIAQPGLPGETLKLKLTLKLLADVGLVGLPNAGKSTLLSRLTQARPKVGSYPFTTLVPNLGVMTFDDSQTLVVADIPGLVEGARLGRGLGHRFLKHIERTQFLLHLLDATLSSENDILSDFLMLRKEMSAYSTALAHKPYFVVINKIDLSDPERKEIKALRKALDRLGTKSMCISALTGEGIDELTQFIFENYSQGTGGSCQGAG